MQTMHLTGLLKVERKILHFWHKVGANKILKHATPCINLRSKIAHLGLA